MPGTGFTTAALYPAVVMVGYFLQVVALLSFSAVGDYGNNRKKYLIGATFAGSFCILLSIVGINSSLWWLFASFRIMSGVFFILAVGWYNSFLPTLTAVYPNVLAAQGSEQRTVAESMISDSVSTQGMAVGYVGGVFSQIVVYVILKNFECFDSTCSEMNFLLLPALCCSLVGLWWAGFSLITFKFLKERPGPPLPNRHGLISLGWRQSCTTICSIIKGNKQMSIFFLAYILASDGFNTFTNVAALLLATGQAGGERPPPSSIMVLNMLGAFGCLVGVAICGPLKELVGATSKTTLVVECVVYCIASAAGGLGAVTALDGMGYYIMVAVGLLVLGHMQALFRSLFALLIPEGEEASYFALFAITDRGSNLIGAVVTFLVSNATGGYIGVYWYLVLAFGIAGALLSQVDVEAGMAVAKQKVKAEVREIGMVEKEVTREVVSM
jgi:UMF1 family MFS transporter